ncbi:MAG TPA: DUF5818 domain-containing protein [Verrucomicrobiae bacterium]|jgi:hypothetical protein|nr:DUF5818 domain-containing protein [Verrucomicrobiae bacterium]
MKKIILSVAGAFLALTVVPQFGLAAAPRAAMQEQSQAQAKTFTGTVTKHGDNFVLSDPGNRTSYMLDDARKASQFEGKKVKVTGTVDTASNTIHVESIEEAA